MVNRLGQEQGEFGPRFKYAMSWDNKPFDHDATMNEEKVLQSVMPGQYIQGTKKKNQYGKFMIFWVTVSESDVKRAGLTPSAHTPPAPAKAPVPTPDYELEKKAHDKKLGLAGIVQAMLTKGNSDYEITGDPADGARTRTAKQWVAWIANESKNMAIAEQDAETFAQDA